MAEVAAAPPYVPYVLYRPHPAWDRHDSALTGALGMGSLTLYLATLAPTLSSVSTDSNELITKAGLLLPAHIPGAPVYIWLAHLFTWLPFGEMAARVNGLSALGGAVAVALLYPLIRRHLATDRWSAVGGAVLFALSLTFWSQAVIAEEYAPSMGMLAVSVLALLEWAAAREGGHTRAARGWLLCAALTFGLSLGIHPSNVLYLPAYGLFMLLGWPLRWGGTAPAPGFWRRFDLVGGAWAAGAGLLAVLLPYAWLYVTLPQVPATDALPLVAPGWPLFQAAVFNAFSNWRFAFPIDQIPDRIVLFLQLLGKNMGPLGVGLLIIGGWRLLFTRLRVFYLLVPLALGNLVFYIDYKVPDIDVFFIPAYWAAAGCVGTGLAAVGVALRALVQARGPLGSVAQRPAVSLGLQAGGARIGPGWLPNVVVAGLIGLGGAWSWQQNATINNVSEDVTFRDLYGNVFSMLPAGATVYHRGAAMGYDMLYYTLLSGVRPDLRVQAGFVPDEPARPPWPDGPIYAGTTGHDLFLPAFMYDPQNVDPKWYNPTHLALFRWTGSLRPPWGKFFRVERTPPPDWLVPAADPAARPQQPLDLAFGPDLTLIGVDAPAQAQRGHVWQVVRYWRTRSADPPRIAGVLSATDGTRLAAELHAPLFEQLPDYLRARQIAPASLPQYVIRDTMPLIIPSNLSPGRYTLSAATISPRLLYIMVDPAPAEELLPIEHPIATVDVVNGPAVPDPLTLRGRGPVEP